MNIQPTLLKDFYKSGHRPQYPDNTEEVYSNMTGRVSRDPGFTHLVTAGIQPFAMEFLGKRFNEDFFEKPKAEVIRKYKRRMDNALGPNSVATDHLEALHDLGYLPIELKALPEGTLVPLRVPVLTIRNTKPEFFWLTNFLETLMSCEIWHSITSATVAFEYRKMLHHFAKETSDMPDFVQWQGHDFSMRGHTSVESAIKSGASHLFSFTGTDTIPAIDYLEEYYGANCEKELIGGSIPATEHSVMCMGGQETELETFRRLITKVYPSGPVSIVSDTWDYWNTMNVTARILKDEIMARPGNAVMPTGKVVFRPDSGDPVKIICGDPAAPAGSPEHKGTVQLLWEIFGGTTNSKGFKQLDPHVGVIYGDSINLDRCYWILKQLSDKKFASTNMVFGIGSYTYQYTTRDTFGFAVKSTHGIIKGCPVDIYKNPKTDNGTKKSAKGYLRVNADMTLSEQVTPEEEKQGMLQTVFLNGKMVRHEKLSEIRSRLLSNLK